MSLVLKNCTGQGNSLWKRKMYGRTSRAQLPFKYLLVGIAKEVKYHFQLLASAWGLSQKIILSIWPFEIKSMYGVARIKIKILNQWKILNKVICFGAFTIFSELTTLLRAWPDDVITGVADHEKLKTWNNSELTKKW